MNTISASEALQRLKDGNARFVKNEGTHPRQDLGRREELTNGQSPFAIILSCADSRVAPELLFDQGLGDIFIIRVAGNVANMSSIASIEYAVAHLGTKLIVVLGHEACGAVTAAIAGGDNGPNLNHLLDHIKPAIQGEEDVNTVVKQNASHVKEDLIKNSTIIAGASDVEIVPAYYNLADGAVDFVE